MPYELNAVVRGRVQGVGYRWTVMEKARGMGLGGWVRNEPDGSVRVLAQGEAEKLGIFLDFLHHGPRHASVENVASNLREIDKCVIFGFNIG